MPDTVNSENQIYFKDGILRINVVGDQTGATVEAMGRELTDEIVKLRQAGKKVLLLDDVSKIGKADMPAVRAVAILGRILDYDRAAMVGDGSAALRTGINLLLKTIAQPNTHYFSNLKDAKIWLRKSA